MKGVQVLVLGLAIAAPLWAQEKPTEDQLVAAAAAAYQDIDALRVVEDLGLTAEQAERAAGLAEGYREKASQIAVALARLDEGAAADLATKKAFLLKYQYPPQDVAARLAEVEQQRQDLFENREDALQTAVDGMLRLLTTDQRARVDGGLETATEPPDPTAVMEARRQQFQQQQAIMAAIGRLMAAARDERDPRRVEALAPRECAQTVVALTGLPADEPAARQLTALFVDRILTVYRMRPIEYRQNAPAIALELARAVILVTQRQAGGGPAASRVDSERIRALMAYPRAAELLREYARFRVEREP